jgi:hypothetical protein
MSTEIQTMAHGIDVDVLMAHVHRCLHAAACAAAGAESSRNLGPLWTDLTSDWAKIRFLLRQAERDGRIEDVLSRHLPTYPRLTWIVRRLGLRRFSLLAIVPCRLGLRLFRPLIRRAAIRQERVNLSLAQGTRGIAARLQEAENTVARFEARLAELEKMLAARLSDEHLPPSAASPIIRIRAAG